MAVDLHLHSKFYDGTNSLEEIVKLADNQNLSYISITDHEVITDVSKINTPYRVKLISGCEVSVNWSSLSENNKAGIHLLFYFVEIDSPLSNQLSHVRKNKIQRNNKIIKKLNNLGFELSELELKPTDDEVLGRPHIAKLMVDKGYISNTQEAFDKYIGNGGPAYVDDHHLDIKELINLSIESKAICILAHPHTLVIDSRKQKFSKQSWINENFVNQIRELIEIGIDGIEAFYPLYNKQTTKSLIDLSDSFNILHTGGSDFHGENKPNLNLGFGYENNPISVPDYIVENLINKYEKLQ